MFLRTFGAYLVGGMENPEPRLGAICSCSVGARLSEGVLALALEEGHGAFGEFVV